MPLLQPREGDNDGGYAVQDYRAVRPDLGTTEDLRDLATTLRGQGISLVMDLVLNHVAREHDWAARARAGEPESARYRDYFHVFPDRDAARRLRAHPAGGLPRLRAGQLHLGRGARRLGLDHVQRVAVGPQLGQPGGAGPSSPRSSCGWPTSGSRCSASTRSPSCGSGWAPAARTSPRCTRSPRRCTRSPGSPRRRWRSRPRRSSARATWSSTSAPARTPAGSATSPTTTA